MKLATALIFHWSHVAISIMHLSGFPPSVCLSGIFPNVNVVDQAHTGIQILCEIMDLILEK